MHVQSFCLAHNTNYFLCCLCRRGCLSSLLNFPMAICTFSGSFKRGKRLLCIYNEFNRDLYTKQGTLGIVYVL